MSLGAIQAMRPSLEGVAAAVAETRRRLGRGEVVPIEDLASDRALVLEGLGREGSRDRLALLQDELDLLTMALQREVTQTAFQLRELTTRDRASRAYGGRS
jgi:hypothetical protein